MSRRSDKCGSCSKVVSDKDTGVQCEVCLVWYHCKCQSIAESVYEVLTKHNDAHWFCSVCSSGSQKMFASVSSMIDKIGKLEEEMARVRSEHKKEIAAMYSEMRQELKACGDALKEQKQQIAALQSGPNDLYRELDGLRVEIKRTDDKVESLIESKMVSYAAKVELKHKEEIAEVSKVISETGQKMVVVIDAKLSECREEEIEREKRKSNVVVFGIAESDATDG